MDDFATHIDSFVCGSLVTLNLLIAQSHSIHDTYLSRMLFLKLFYYVLRLIDMRVHVSFEFCKSLFRCLWSVWNFLHHKLWQGYVCGFYEFFCFFVRLSCNVPSDTICFCIHKLTFEIHILFTELRLQRCWYLVMMPLYAWDLRCILMYLED